MLVWKQSLRYKTGWWKQEMVLSCVNIQSLMFGLEAFSEIYIQYRYQARGGTQLFEGLK